MADGFSIECINVGDAPDIPGIINPLIEDDNRSTITTISRRSSDADKAVDAALERSVYLSERFTAIAENVLQSLSDYAGDSTEQPEVALEIDDAPSFGISIGSAPTPPFIETPETSDIPTIRGNIDDIVVQEIGDFDGESPDAPGDTLVWEELPYISTLLDRLQSTVEDIIYNGGTGLSEEYINLVRENALQREELQHEARYNEAENYYASKGYSAPPGALISRLNMLNKEKLRQDTIIQNEITAKLLDIAHQHGEFMTDIGIKLESITTEQKDKINARALDAAKAYVAIIYEAYSKKLEKYSVDADVYKTRWEAEDTRIKAIGSKNESIADVYKAELQAYNAKLQAEFGIIEHVVKVYIAEISGYEANVRAEEARLGALIEGYKAQLDAQKTRGALAIEEFRALIDRSIKEIDLRMGAQKEAGRIASQIAASSLSAFNASATISDSVHSGENWSYSDSKSNSNSFSQAISQSLGVSYNTSKSQSSQCNKSESLSHSYYSSTS